METMAEYVLKAEESIGTTLLRALLDEVQQLPDLWQKLNERRQAEMIDRLRSQVEDQVRQLVLTVCARGFTALPADLESLTFKDGAKAVLKLSRTGESIHELADNVGGRCLIVLATAAEFTDGMFTVQPDPDQADLIDGIPETEAA